MSLPMHKRYEIVFLSVHPKGPKLGKGEVAKAVKCSESTVKYWLKRWTQTKDLSDQICKSRKRATTKKQDQMIVALAERNDSLNLTEIRNSLKRKGVVISKSTVQRRLLESGGKWAPPVQKPLLSTKHRNIRLSWARNMKDMDWNRVIFTDKSTFELHQNTRRVWLFPFKKN
jgi:transposase